MDCIEFLIVLAMASLYFSIVPWCVGLDQLVTNIKLLQGFFKERWMPVRAMRAILQRVQCAVIALHPAVNVLPVGVITHRSLCNAVLLCKLSLYCAVCVILFIVNRVRLPFGFVLAT